MSVGVNHTTPGYMEKNKKKNKLVRKLRHKYRLTILNEQTYEELFSMRLSQLNVFISFGFTAMFLVLVTTVIISFTNLREYIPGYPSGEQRRMMIRNYQRVDSLLFEIDRRDRFIGNMRAVISGDLPADAFSRSDTANSKNAHSSAVKLARSKEDSLFRLAVEEEERFNVSNISQRKTDTRLELMYFFPPLKGVVTNRYGDSKGHYGIDVVAVPGSRVSAVLEGTVIFSGWTVETGYVIQLQHANQLVSIYKHNGKLLKEVGDNVRAGEAIATVGNSGEYTTGPHLHFELWYGGVPLNPENYISFE